VRFACNPRNTDKVMGVRRVLGIIKGVVQINNNFSCQQIETVSEEWYGLTPTTRCHLVSVSYSSFKSCMSCNINRGLGLNL
jgi:hypothetical protein